MLNLSLPEPLQALGQEAQGSGCIYFTGGASALLVGWRSSTSDLIRFPAINPDGVHPTFANSLAGLPTLREEHSSTSPSPFSQKGRSAKRFSKSRGAGFKVLLPGC